jgi:hypothetical protein
MALVICSKPAQKQDGSVSADVDFELVSDSTKLGIFNKLEHINSLENNNAPDLTITNQVLAFTKERGIGHDMVELLVCYPPGAGPGLYSFTVRVHDELTGFGDSFTIGGLEFLQSAGYSQPTYR